MTRCAWVTSEPLYIAYHDEEWGVPVRDDRKLFEFLVLEGAQAGLSWLTVLKKRESYRAAFAGFDPTAVANFSQYDVARLMQDSGIVRNARKIASAIANANAFLAVADEFGSFSAYLWNYVGGIPQIHAWHESADVPATSSLSETLSRDLRKRGFTFVGSTICYSFLQATGVVMDHVVSCDRYQDLCGIR